MTNRAIFLDRDGVLNELVYYPDFDEDESPRLPEHLRLMLGTHTALHTLQQAGWHLFIVSNQPSHAKGKTSLGNLKAVHQALLAQLADILFKKCYYSYTHPTGVVQEYATESVYRKPRPGFLLEAQRDFGIDLQESWMVGDRDTDIQCGQAVGMSTAQLQYPLSRGKQGSAQPDLICADLPDFVLQLTGTSCDSKT